MDQHRTTPPDGPERQFAWGERRRPPGEEPQDDPLFGTHEPDWSAHRGTPPPPRSGRLDLSALFVLLDALRRAAPAELQERVTALIREALLTLRSLIDWYLERLDRPARPPEVEEIPID